MNLSEYRGASVLLVPGLGNSGPAHWQTRWEAQRADAERVELGLWNSPRRNPWVTRLDQAIRAAHAPVILVAHSLGCLAVAWWATLEAQPWGAPVAGALLVAPPDLASLDRPMLAAEFGPRPRSLLPFASILVASQDDPYASAGAAFDMAKDWGSHFVDAGAHGHLNAASGLGDWSEGLSLLDRLIDIAGEDGAPDRLHDAQAVYDRVATPARVPPIAEWRTGPVLRGH